MPIASTEHEIKVISKKILEHLEREKVGLEEKAHTQAHLHVSQFVGGLRCDSIQLL